MIAGYAVFSVIMVIYLVSLAVRRRNLEQDLSTLEAIGATSEPVQSKPPAARRPASRARVGKPGAARRAGARKRAARKK
jgi:hypothetical protein